MNGAPAPALRFYNPDWLSDDDLVAGFIARHALFDFLRGELRRAPVHGNVQHYLLVGVRGSGKTTLLKRLAVAIRRDADLDDHLVALSFPEELYQVKGLGDFWWAACRALEDTLDLTGQRAAADRLAERIEAHEQRHGAPADPHDDAGLRLLLQTGAELQRRPVLLVDNLDLVLRRIDKTGRKLNDPHAQAYWALREALSTQDAPLVIAGSVRLSEPFVGYDKAFYDFFIPHRLGKLSLEEVQDVFDHLARHHGGEELRQRIRQRPGRVRALYEMTGGNPRALGLIFELLRQGPGSRAVDDFERLLDLTTPYYKARFEDLPEQAQVVMHALALARRDPSKAAFGHTAASVGQHAGLETRTVSAQLDVLVNEGVVEKSGRDKGRMQYRIAEQLFRLWLQMRSTRRIRQQVVGLTEFLEALFDRDEYEQMIRAELDAAPTASARSRARMHWALGELQTDAADRRYLQSHAADAMLRARGESEGGFDEAFLAGDLPADVESLGTCREALRRCAAGLRRLRPDADALTHGLLGSLTLNAEQKRTSVAALCERATAADELSRIAAVLDRERDSLLRDGLTGEEIDLLHRERESGRLSLHGLSPGHRELRDRVDVGMLVWKLLGARRIPLTSSDRADAWIIWGKSRFPDATGAEWAAVARAMRRAGHLEAARTAVNAAFDKEECSRAWYELGVLNEKQKGDTGQTEVAFRKAVELDPADAWPWNGLGNLLTDRLKRYDEAEAAYRKAIELDPAYSYPWNGLGNLLADQLKRYDEAEAAYRKAIELDPAYAIAWRNLGRLLADHLQRDDEAEAAYGRALELEPEDRFTRIQLSELSSRRMLASSVKAIEANVWAALHQTLSVLIADNRLSQRWFVEKSFVEGVVGRALHDGHGLRMLASLRELGFERIAAPLLIALDAAIDGGAEKLASAEPEARTAAIQLFERLQAAKAGEQCPPSADAGRRMKESHDSRPRRAKP